MPKDVIITPASGNVQFRQASGNTEGLIELTDTGFLKITSANSGVLLGDAATDIYVGDGVTSVDIIFEQNGAVRALTGKTLTLGQSDATVRINAPLQITNTTLVANLNADLLDGLSSASFANAAFANTDFTTISTTAGTYANASHVPVITLAANGRVSSIVNTSVAIAASQVTSGTLPIARGGTNGTSFGTGNLIFFNGTSLTSIANTGTAGTYANASHVPVVTTDAYGRVSAVTNTAIAISATQVTSGTLPIARGGTNATTYTTGAALQFNGTSIATLANTGTAGTYANATHVPVITTDAYGRVSGVTNTAISFPVTSVAGVTGAVSNTQLLNGIIAVDGTSSGLDADLLDGQQGSYYLDTSSSSQTKSGNLTVSGITTTGEQRFVNSYVQHFSQVYSGGATGSPAGYFSNGEFQEICTFTPSGSSQNCQVIGRIAIQSGGNSQIIYFQAALRSGTLPDLAWTTSYYEEVNGGTRYADPVVWAKETTTAAFKLALNGLATIFGTVTVDLDVIHRYNTGYPDFVMNTTVSSEVLSVPAGYTSYDFTKLYSINDGKVEIEGTTASTSNTTGALTVNGGVGVTGNVYADGIYDSGVEVLTFAQAAFNKANQSAQLAFTTVAANGTSLVADANTDTLTITANTANGIQILSNATTDTLDLGLRLTGVTPGTYGNSSTILTLTIDQFGRITQVTSNTVTAVETDPLALAFAIALG